MIVEKRVLLNAIRKKIVFKSIGGERGGEEEEKESGFTSNIEWNQWQTLSREWLYLIYVLEDDSDYYSFLGEGWSAEIGKELEFQTIHDEENA